MQQLKVSDLIIEIDGELGNILKRYESFFVPMNSKFDMNVHIECNDFIDTPEGSLITDEFIKWLKKPCSTDGYYVYTKGKHSDSVLTLGDFDSKWRNGKISYFNSEKEGAPNYKEHTDMYLHNLLGIFFRYCLIHHNGIVIHSSTIEHNGKGIMFSAPSGTGKSTHVKLWQQKFGKDVTVINDDTPAVRLLDNKPVVYGTPWSGTSNIHANISAPLSAIVILEQSPVNQINRLTVQEAILKLMPRVFLPYFDQEMMQQACSIFESILTSVPVYLLKCRPDAEAVEMVYECVN